MRVAWFEPPNIYLFDEYNTRRWTSSDGALWQRESLANASWHTNWISSFIVDGCGCGCGFLLSWWLFWMSPSERLLLAACKTAHIPDARRFRWELTPFPVLLVNASVLQKFSEDVRITLIEHGLFFLKLSSRCQTSSDQII